VFGPLPFVALLVLLAWPARWSRDRRAIFLAAFTLANLLPILTVSLLSKANANWAASAYVAASIWVSGALMSAAAGVIGPALLSFSIFFHVAVGVWFLGGSIGRSGPGLYWNWALPAQFEILHPYTGWRALGDEISKIQSAYPDVPLLGHDRMMVAATLYYGHPQPVSIFSWHTTPAIGDHFQLTRPWEGKEGADALLLNRVGDPKPILAQFKSHDLLATLSVPVATGKDRVVRMFYARGFDPSSGSYSGGDAK
jgi:hypothetical protein